ncbi:nucleoside transporter [Xylariaceae sp. AK1471]|nr:nucleoside transporter [Xylariaceae sp. AK1471]
MNRLRSFFHKEVAEQEYAPLAEETRLLEGAKLQEGEYNVPFSWLEYGAFALLGIAMLWAWNMFLAAAPYFQGRFQTDEWVLQNFQSAILSVSTITNLGTIILISVQSTASYPFRINLALYINIAVFALLTISTSTFLDAQPSQYLGFLLVMAGGCSCAAGLMQNGAFAFAASFGRPEYMQAIMAGQGVAGVLPPLTQIISVLVALPKDLAAKGDHDNSNSAFIYFLTAVFVSLVAIVVSIPLVRKHNQIIKTRMVNNMAASFNSVGEVGRANHKVVSLSALSHKLRWFAAAVFLCFAVAMFFPVLTSKVLSVSDPEKSALLLSPAAFIPLGFFSWNLGDLVGRTNALILPCRDRPVLLFVISVARTLFLPLYILCNIHGNGAVINSDVFYLLLVQFPFGFTNGWLASNCMIGASEWVDEGEKEASGSFMSLCLVAGLTFGSLLSFTAAGV